ncbi:glycogen/starch/alpha-glucan phosphorylase [Rubidibacter lacunae KORDI 51-2]|uniref:Alpha-1,4 glucan phosphorylase n=1 Tax=Rubidibacter lacunae KORDI 51-2 TaxID=582515 RepID=U5D7B2_9CHRO|nr:glycogen/starch/alpha-glucan phosphorylase [Rubidibacter lacunae]ERN40523.1 glycogen/starch/alpha-glucan phosphorylase [Rubidibacter lacunae KORDI 51-2]
MLDTPPQSDTPQFEASQSDICCIEDDRTGLSLETLVRGFADNLFYVQGKYPGNATLNDYYMALAYTVRDRLLQRWLNTIQSHLREDVRVVCYMSAEYLLGPHLANNLLNLGLEEQIRRAVEATGLSLDDLIAQEEEPGLGNGGLGRLAACYMDSLSTLEIPAVGYGIRYEFGIFDQAIRNGWQVEITDKWLQLGNPWEIARPEEAVEVKLGGYTEVYHNSQGAYRVHWHPGRTIKGVPYDTPIPGYRVNTANTLRLWKAEAPQDFDFQAFNTGDYYGAVKQKILSENITKVLYPNDEQIEGKELRLAQQYFFVSCSLQDMIRMHLNAGGSLETFHQKYTAQLNDTHPAVAVAELMRLLVDVHHFQWDKAWDITRKTFAYTNHTLLPEALEKWPLELFGRLLPRHLEIVYEINNRFLDRVRVKYLGDEGHLAHLSLIDEQGERYVRMAHLACVGSYAINGVAALHTELLKQDVLHDFNELYPGKIQNKTNGVTPRRWLALCNPRLTDLLRETIGEDWLVHLDQLRKLEFFVDDAGFRERWRGVKQANKQALSAYVREHLNIDIDPNSLFDVQIKRIHEYKRQHLNALHIVSLYAQIKLDPNADIVPRTFVFAGKAAPGYFMAKRIIKLITSIADIVNNDPDVGERLRVVFVPDYNVTNSQRLYPAANLSEQISTAGKEASGTGNMKFALSGALTIGTLDGANVEIREEVGAENFFLFGLTAPEVKQLKQQGYRPRDYYKSNPLLKETIDLIASGYFSHGDRELFVPLLDSLLKYDPFLVLADFQAYVDAQKRVSAAYCDTENWTRMSILNSARMGKFSSDRAIREYARDIWKVQPLPIELEGSVEFFESSTNRHN